MYHGEANSGQDTGPRAALRKSFWGNKVIRVTSRAVKEMSLGGVTEEGERT